ncbi:DUF2867 domain-containing protein [Reichenbachiella carrageenanivorans]|uniref:DUF2867 domain-containing protein n=1 Tax=Reichenbachiella carrageenanivorans TaxID=2979869 RepID=A0ABY6D5X9_9BACT|nr:DUF2867 domain-containing protein [Reichenbachiella carrageenanivorans]UXX80473.1 DUF2867 domain-containing protein [Reichenbachiella carrageenanivorans]
MTNAISAHLAEFWLAHQITKDYRIEDTWLLPIELREEHLIGEVQDTFVQAISQIETKGFAGWLFKLRVWLGQLFHWDEPVNSSKTKPVGLLKTRYNQLTKTESLPAVGDFQHFDSVYVLDNEALLEIENKTVQAAIHFGLIQKGATRQVQMTIYVKPNGLFGQLYMLAIKPFRHWIVYPTLLQAVAKQWKQNQKRQR